MWSRQLFIVWFFALTILATQSHVIHKRGLISKLFGGNSKSTHNVEGNLPTKERSKFRQLLKNPVVIAMLGAAVGMIVQKALAAKNMNDVCENKYIQMARTAGNISPDLQQVINLLGCNAPNRHRGSASMPNDQFSSTSKYGLPSTTSSSFSDDENENENEGGTNDQEATLESRLPPEKESKVQQLLNVFHGQKGAKRNFVRGLFGMKKKDYTFKQGHKLPSSSYKLDKDDANALKDLETELDQFNKSIN